MIAFDEAVRALDNYCESVDGCRNCILSVRNNGADTLCGDFTGLADGDIERMTSALNLIGFDFTGRVKKSSFF